MVETFDLRRRFINIARLMTTMLYESIELKPLAVSGDELAGDVAFARLPRVRDLLDNDAGSVRVVLRFALRSDGRVLINSRLDGALPLKCQRCLGTFEFPVSVESALVAVETEATAAALDDGDLEPVIAVDGRLVLADIVEEELLLALPIAPKHRNAEDCGGVAKEFVVQGAAEEPGPRTHKPFENLKDLMH